MKIKLFTLANILTLINAFCGCCAVLLIFNGYASEAFYFTIISLVADFLDGFAARKFGGGGSDIGKQLDSLADAISFGLVPAALFYSLLANFTLQLNSEPILLLLYPSIAFIIVLFGILRLAKFNIDTRQGDEFIGLATPAMTLFVYGYLFICNGNNDVLSSLLQHIRTVLITIVVLCFLMISEIRMFSFKFKQWTWSTNQLRYVFILISIVLLILFQLQALAFIILLYILISIVQHYFINSTNIKTQD